MNSKVITVPLVAVTLGGWKMSWGKLAVPPTVIYPRTKDVVSEPTSFVENSTTHGDLRNGGASHG